ncbi:serine-rich adhesin for platelets [Anabrus simplex]|uniref:serine-rich adhesin for platelets n=1 Tax=Anabrus simplex TaxID=316456 RepID=UPI0035A3A987
MGKKGNKRKTRWRVLPIGGDNGDSLCSTNDDEGDGDPVSSSPTTPVNGSWSNGRPAFSSRGPAKLGKQRLGYQQPSYRQHPQRGGYNDSKTPAVTTEKKTFNEEEYTKITTPRQDVLFKKGYLGRKKPALTNATNSADTNAAPSTEVHQLENAGVADHEPTEPPDTPHFLCTNGYVDQGGVYYINGGSYELYDPYTGNVTVVVGPAPHGPPLLAAVSCQPVPLQPLEWFNPPFHSYVPAACPDRRKRSSTDSQNWSPQSSESTDPPGSPQEGEDMGLQNGVVEPLEDCTVYQPPTYVYPGYMFGPAVYNMNGINIQGLPPQPQSIDISGSKRRKKKRRRRRRRGGVDDGSEESTSDENDLEEPVSLTSQESSQEVESDSKNSAESTGCKVGSGETNSSEKILEPSSNLTDTTSVNVLENGPYVQPAETNSPNIKPQLVVDEYSRSSESERSEGNKDTSITNSCVSDFTTGTLNSVSKPRNCHEINEVPLPKSLSETISVQNSCDDNIFNGPTKAEKCSLECNNTANRINCLTATTNVIQNSVYNSTEQVGINNTVTTKERSKGKRTSKSSKQKQQQQQQQHNHTDGAEVQLTHVQLQTVQHKMDGNEYSKLRGSNDGTDCSETSNEPQFKTKPVPNRPDQAKTSGATRAPGSGDTSPNDPPKKPLRKDCSQQQKQAQKKLSSSVHKERKDRVGATKTSKNQPQSCSKESSENQVTSSEVHFIKPSQHSDEYEIQLSVETNICTKVPATSECFTSSQAVKSDSDQLKLISPLCNLEEAKEGSIEDEEFKYGSDESAVVEGTPIVSKNISRHPRKVERSISETVRGNEDSASSVNVTLSNEEVFTCVTTGSYSKTPEKGKDNIKEYAMHIEESLSPPPIPPPRRKKWHPCNKRPSTERPPTPGRDLEDRRSSEVLTDDSSSTSTSRESEESVIEIVSSTRSAKCKSVSLETQHSSEGDEGVICDIQHFCNTASETHLQNPLSETRVTPEKYDSTYEVNTFPNHTKSPVKNVPVKEKSNSYGIAQKLPNMGQNTHTPTPNFQLNDSVQQQITFRQPLDGSTQEQTHHEFNWNTLGNLSLGKKNYVICMSSVEKFSENMASRVMEEALFGIKNSKSDQAFSWPITEAVTRWLRSQSTEEVLPVPELRDSESDFTEEVEEESTKCADVIQENIAGPKNVLRNPLPALLHECNCTDNGVGIRVATNNFELKHLKSKDSSDLRDTLNNDDKTHTINNNNERANNVLKEMYRNDEDMDTKLYEDDLLNTIDTKKNSWQEFNYHSSRRDAEIAFNSLQDDGDSIITGESVEYDADWECDTVTLKPSLHVIDNNDTNPCSESPDCRCLHMCDPALSVAKYYRLGPQTDKTDVVSQDHCIESEEEIDKIDQFRCELYDSTYDCSHCSLANELEFCEKPLPESWSIDRIKLTSENNGSTHDILKMKYVDCTTSDSGIQSEESGNEDSRKPSTNSSNIFSNSAKLFNRNSAIHMTGITGEGPFPCGGICCILQ